MTTVSIRLRGLVLAAVLLTGVWSAPATAADDEMTAQVGAFLDGWHADAAHADLRYFDKMAADGVYIGTDRSERWVRDDFKAWAKPYFARGKAWEFHAFNRHVAASADHNIIWFDEQLHTQMGICQASGVIRQDRDGMHIVHYQLSLAVPNDLVNPIKKQIEDYEAGKAGARSGP